MDLQGDQIRDEKSDGKRRTRRGTESEYEKSDGERWTLRGTESKNEKSDGDGEERYELSETRISAPNLPPSFPPF